MAGRLRPPSEVGSATVCRAFIGRHYARKRLMSRVGKGLILVAIGSFLTLVICGGLVLRNIGSFGEERLMY